MLVNDSKKITKEEILSSYSEKADIKFLRYYNYDKYCSLCEGILELSINGEKVSFGPKNADFSQFFTPTVCWANPDYERTSQTDWETDVSELPDKYKCFAKIIDEVINKNIPKNICRGCD